MGHCIGLRCQACSSLPFAVKIVTMIVAIIAEPAAAVDEYRLDDGVKEAGFGIQTTGNLSFAWLNQFTVQTGAETISAVRLAFGGRMLGQNHIPNGTVLTVYLWADPNQDADPTDAGVLSSATGVVANTGLNTINDYPLVSPVTLNPGEHFFAGAIINYAAASNDVLVGSLDDDGTDDVVPYPPALHSWIAGGFAGNAVDPNHLDLAPMPVALVANAVFGGAQDGTWMIRLNAGPIGGGTPALDVTPSSLNFGPSRVGDLAGPLAVDLISVGTAPVLVSGIQPVSAPFFLNSLVPGACPPAPFSLIPGDSCTLDYTFAPTWSGLTTTTVLIGSNAPPPPPAPVLLSGIGVDVVIGTVPGLLDFGAVALGQTASMPLQVFNLDNGSGQGVGFALNVWSLAQSLPPELSIDPGSCGPFPFTLAYLASCEVLVEFTPSVAAPLNHANTLTSDASAGSADFVVVGRGGDALFADRFEF